MERELDRLVRSAEFRSTRRLQHYLRYLVERLLQSRTDVLKERVIGAEFFNRAPDYE